MILACPFCRTRFLVAASLFASGPRQMMCAKCKHGWKANASDDQNLLADHAPGADEKSAAEKKDWRESDIKKPDIPIPQTLPSTALPEPAPIFAPWAKRYFSYFFMALALLLFLTFFFDRYALARKWAFLEPFYDIIGLHIYHTGEGLSIRSVRSELVYEDGIMKLMVEGKIVNTTKNTQEMPAIRASAIASDGQAMQDWQIDAPAARVAPGGEIPFRSSINAPQGTVADINLNFVETNTHGAE